MRRVDRSPSPPNWENKLSTLARFGLVVFVGGMVYFLVQTVASVAQGSWPAAVTAGGLAVFTFGLFGALSFTFLVSATRYAEWGPAGTTVRVNPAIAWSYGVALLGGVVGSSCYLLFVSRGLVNLPFAAPGGGRVNRYLMITLLVLSVTGLIALLRSREPGYLRVGIDGIEHADIFRTRSARWNDVVDVIDKADKKVRNPIVFVVKDAKPIVVPNADRFASSGAPLYWMARHYWTHPEHRDELADGRALDRLRNGQFEAS